jgi:hypothetical protein
MTRILIRYAAAMLASLAVCLPAAATTTGDDYSDIWWAGQAENGWGINFIQQGGTIFATMFVYGPDNTPRWYTATMAQSTSSAYTGPMYSTNGTFFGASTYNPGSFTFAQVGNMSVNFGTPYSGTLQYSVNGQLVTKSIIRQSFANNNLTGHYLGGLTANGTNCQAGVTNGPILIFDTLNVAQSGQSLSMVVTFYSAVLGTFTQQQCTFNGTLTSQGRVGNVTNGTWTCTTGNHGNFTLDMVDASQNGLNARFSGSDQYCTYNGFFGGLKDVPF